MEERTIQKVIDQISSTHPDCQGTEIDGLIHCDKCGKPRQAIIQILGRPRKQWIMCECMIDKQTTEEQKFRMKLERESVERMRTIGFPEESYKKNTFDADNGSQPEAMKICRNFVNRFDAVFEKGTTMLFYGPTGTGKSFASNAIANALIDKGIPVLTTSFSHVIGEVMAAPFDEKEKYFRDVLKYPLVVIDDLGIERNSEFASEVIFRIINDRVNAEKPMIITTNLPVSFFKEPPSDAWARICSRIIKKCYPVKFDGKDQRKSEFTRSYTEMKDLLGG